MRRFNCWIFCISGISPITRGIVPLQADHNPASREDAKPRSFNSKQIQQFWSKLFMAAITKRRHWQFFQVLYSLSSRSSRLRVRGNESSLLSSIRTTWSMRRFNCLDFLHRRYLPFKKGHSPPCSIHSHLGSREDAKSRSFNSKTNSTVLEQAVYGGNNPKMSSAILSGSI